MDTSRVDPVRLRAGAEYLSALRSLGIEPDALFWAYDLARHDAMLVLVSSFFDAVGPFAMQETLFKAYKAAATPREIDPFVVRLHSPKHRVIRELWEKLGPLDDIEIEGVISETGEAKTYRVSDDDVGFTMARGDFAVPVKFMYKFKMPGSSKPDLAMKWKSISRTVDRLAA